MATAPEIHRWSPEDYHRLVESGGLEDLRVELIDGVIVDDLGVVTAGRHER